MGRRRYIKHNRKHNTLVFSIIAYLFISIPVMGQLIVPRTNITPESRCLNFDDAFHRKGISNRLDMYLLPYQIALRYYPELNNVAIEYAFKSIKTTMAARPRLSFLYKSPNKRKYLFIFNNEYQRFKGVGFEELSLNAQVGLMSHELAHIIDYENKSRWKIIKTGFGYLFKKHKRRLESEVDYIAIERGLGWQVYDFNDYVQNKSGCSSEYKKFKKEAYFSSGDVFFFIYNLKVIY